jgi:anti-sigma B factor antagonist
MTGLNAGELQVVVTCQGSTASLELYGDLDVYTAPILLRRVDHALDGGMRTLVLNMRSVQFADTSGLGALVTGRKQARACGAQVALAAVPERTMKVLAIIGLDSLFVIHQTAADAIEAAVSA